MFQFTRLPPLSLYIHFPWCERKCPYCDFNSHQPNGAIPERAYIDALLRDLSEDLPRVWGRSVSWCNLFSALKNQAGTSPCVTATENC